MRGFVLLALLAASAHAEIQRPSAGLSSLPLRSKSSQGLTARRVLSVDHATAAAAASKGELVRGGGADARGALSIAGGMMVHLALGTMYCWGNFMSYMPKSMLYFDGGAANGRTPDALYVLPGALLGLNIGLQAGSRLNNKIGVTRTSLLGGVCFAASVYFASFQTTLLPFMLIYSLAFGVSIGTAYTAPMVAGWSWFPNRKGFVSGCVLAAFGAGGFLGNKVGTAIVNPDGVQAVAGAFPAEIYAKFPSMLRKLSGIYLALLILGSSLIKSNPASLAAAAKSSSGSAKGGAATSKTFGEALKSKEFALLWAMIVLSATAGLNTIGVYKRFGQTVAALNDDAYLSLMGGLGALFNGLGRLFWASMVDKFGFKGPFQVSVAIQAVMMACYRYAAQSKFTFAVATCAIFSCIGGNFAMAPTVTNIEFGTALATKVYAVLFTAFVTASIGGSMVTKRLLKAAGWDAVFSVLAAASAVSIVLSGMLKPPKEG
jgi:OFA family oxalate/formate antiporter-like MFS transporter